MNMPFTPFHFGPALGFGFLFRRYMHLPSFIVGNVVVDFEPFLVIVLGLMGKYPLHGYLHTFILAFPLGIALGYIMFLLEGFFQPIYKALLFKSERTSRLKPFIIAGVSGIMLHVALDSPLYDDIRPFYPLTVNPLYNPSLSLYVYSFCVWMGLIGIAFYLGLLILLIYRRFRKK